MHNLKERFVAEDKLVATVMQVSRVCGLAPVCFTGTRNGTVMIISRSWHIFTIFLTIIAFIGHIYSMIHILDGSFYNGEVPEIVRVAFLLCNSNITMLLFICGALYGMRRTRSFLSCFEETRKVTKRVGNDNEFNSRKWPLFVYISICFIPLGLGSLSIWYYNEWNLIICFLYLMYCIVNMLGLQFMMVVMSINSAFKAINQSLQEVLANIHLSETNSAGPEDILDRTDVQFLVNFINIAVDLTETSDQVHPDLEFMQKIKIAHKVRQITFSFASTCVVLRKLNSSEGVILFLQFALFTLDLVDTIYNILNSLLDNDLFLKNYFKLLQFFWLLYHVTKVLVLVEPCWWTQEEVSNTRLLVGRIMCYVTNETDHLREEINDFFKQLVLQNPSYSAVGICDIGRPLISKIIGSVTTILILSYQF